MRRDAPHTLTRQAVIRLGLVVWLAGLAPLGAQATSPRFERLDGEAGLSHNSVYAITQDREGFLWFGTADGLNRYDGYQFVTYRHDPQDTASLPNSLVLDLHPDTLGRLWVATPDGLSRFDPTTERFRTFVLQAVPGGPRARAVTALLGNPGGALWAATDAGLFRHTAADSFVAVYPEAVEREVERRVQAVRRAPSGDLWLLVGQRGDWQLLRLANAQVVERYALADEWNDLHFDDFRVDRDGRIWLSGGGPASLDREAGLARPPPGVGDIGPTVAWATEEGPDGTVWVGTSDGLIRAARGADAPVRETLDRTRSGYVFNFVRALFEDRAGTLWVGTHGGIYRADPHAKPFRHLTGDPANPRALSSSAVSAVTLTDGTLWLGTLGAGLNRLDQRTGLVRRFSHRAGDPTSLPDDVVWSLLVEPGGRLWVGTGCGLASLDPGGARFRRHRLRLSGDPACVSISAIERTTDGDLWLAGGPALLRYRPSTASTTEFRPPTPADGTRPGLTQSLLVADDTTIWIGMLPAELVRFNPASGEFSRHALLLPGGERLESEAIWALHRGADGALWLGTGAGLSRFDPRVATFRHYFERDGLPGSVVYGVLEGEAGELWLSTNRGLARFEPLGPAPRFRVYDATTGVGNTEFNRNASFRGTDGTLYFGGLDGLTWFDPGAIVENTVVPPVVLTRIETASRAGIRRHNPRGLERLELSYRDYSLEFEFAALSYTNPARNRYAYRLEGFDADWVDAGTRRFVRYTDLPPGGYVLRIRGSNNDGAWDEPGIALALDIAPPFWQTWPFRLAAVLLLLALGWAAYRARVGHLLEIERLRLRIAGDLHDDLSSNLVGIALAGERLQRVDAVGPDEQRQLTRISETARRMVQDLRDIVWLVDPSRDEFDDLVLKIRDLAEALLPDAEVEIRAEAPSMTGRLGLAFRRQLYLITKELLHNVARHAGASRVEVTLSDAGGGLLLRVTDNGAGFDPAASSSGFGLRNIRTRAEELGGAVEVTATPGDGAVVAVRLPIP
jgi:signal transduction histidine kinase/ligand-binding sensor domain-containing protein